MNKNANIYAACHSRLVDSEMKRKLRVLSQHWGYLIKSGLIGEQRLAQLKNPSLYLMLLIEASVFAMAYTGAYLLRFEFVAHIPRLRPDHARAPLAHPVEACRLFRFRALQGDVALLKSARLLASSPRMLLVHPAGRRDRVLSLWFYRFFPRGLFP